MSTATNQNQHLDSTIEAFDKGLSGMKSGSSRRLSSWIETLSADESTSKIADELKKLKELISGDDIDSAKLKKQLHSIGLHTTKAAKSAEGSTAEKIKALGEKLTKASDDLK